MWTIYWSKAVPLKTRAFDVAAMLETDEDIREFLADAFENGSEEEFIHALGSAARAKELLGFLKK